MSRSRASRSPRRSSGPATAPRRRRAGGRGGVRGCPGPVRPGAVGRRVGAGGRGCGGGEADTGAPSFGLGGRARWPGGGSWACSPRMASVRPRDAAGRTPFPSVRRRPGIAARDGRGERRPACRRLGTFPLGTRRCGVPLAVASSPLRYRHDGPSPPAHPPALPAHATPPPGYSHSAPPLSRPPGIFSRTTAPGSNKLKRSARRPERRERGR